MTTSRDLAKAQLFLLVYSSYICVIDPSDSDWVLCNNRLYKKYLADELVTEGHFELYNSHYVTTSKHLEDTYIK